MKQLAHIYRLGLKELTSLRHDSVLLLFLLYAFSVAIYMPAAGSVIGVHNASVAFVDEDHSSLSRRLAEALQQPQFQPPALISYADMDPALDSGRYTFVINVPANFQADLLAGRQPALQVNVDATAMSQAFMGAGYIRRIFQRELYDAAQQSPDQITSLASRALFNSNLESGWFLGVIQIVNEVTILAIILTGTALLREREHGTLDHLLVLPLTALEIMLAKVWSNALVVVCCTWLSLELVFTNKSWRAFRLDTTIKDNAITFPALSPFGNQINAGPQVMKGAIYKGRWGNFDLWLYNDWFIDPLDNVEKPMIPDGAVIMSGADLMGTRAFGVILDPAFNYGPLAYAPKSWVKEDPAQRLILMQSSPLVIPSRVNASLCATVV